MIQFETDSVHESLPTRSEQIRRNMRRIARRQWWLVHCCACNFAPDCGNRFLRLSWTANRLVKATRGCDLAVRLGGDEFFVDTA